jgi:formylmethanofuran dehydrogenase subunit E
MVDLAMSRIPEGTLFEAISETASCLPDAIQLLTRCTVGNNRLKVINLGRFALSLYDKYEGKGVRVFLDVPKLEAWPEIKAWLLKLKQKSEQDEAAITSEIERAGHSICSLQPVQIHAQYLGKRNRGPITICKLCHEPYPARDGAICLACRGEAPYIGSGQSDAYCNKQRCLHYQIEPLA